MGTYGPIQKQQHGHNPDPDTLKSKTDTLDTVKTRILSDAALRNDFDGCVNLFQDFIEQTQDNMTNPIRIASVGSRPTDSKIQPDMYYTLSEYNKLSPEKKFALKTFEANEAISASILLSPPGAQLLHGVAPRTCNQAG